METKEIKKAINKLQMLCAKKSINYVLTGTTALEVLGLNISEPSDIDILIRPEDLPKFNDLALMSSYANESEYTEAQGCAFTINEKVKVNVICEENTVPYIPIFINDIDFVVKVHSVYAALEAKFKRNRTKDYAYFNTLLKKYSLLFPEL